jgi:anaerobic magnesium-protoporphyrin IX monomethyl ester cyclase
MKVLLIKPPLTLPKYFKGVAHLYPPIGLEYIAAVLEKNNIEVKILDATAEDWKRVNDRGNGVKYLGMPFDDIAKRVAEEKPNVVGITMLSVDKINALRTAEAIRKISKDIVIVAGGAHVSAMPEETLSDSNIDIITVGEGEYSMLDIVKELENEKPDLGKIKGIWYKKDGAIMRNEQRPLTENLDELPFPARHLVDYERYFEASKSLQGSRSLPKRGDVVITSRGCPFGCVFCSIRFSMGRGWRPRSPENVISEIEFLVEKYKIEHINFEDDNLTFDKDRMNRICDLLIEKGLNKKITWSTPNGVRADRLDEPLLAKMKESGCVCIIVAPESGSQHVLDDIIHKSLRLEKVEEVVKICAKIGLHCDCFFVIGFPGETKENVEETLRFMDKIKGLGGHPLPPFIAQPYYGTDLYNIAKENGYMTKKDGEELELAYINEGSSMKVPGLEQDYLLNIRRSFQRKQDVECIREIIFKRPDKLLRLFILHPREVIDYIIKFLFLRRKE